MAVKDTDLGLVMSRVDQQIRVLERTEGRKLSDRSISMLAGLYPGAVSNLRKQLKAKKQNSLTMRTLSALAVALKVTPEWLLTGAPVAKPTTVNNHPTHGAMLHVMGEAIAGRWVEHENDQGAPQTRVLVAPHPLYPPDQQFALEARGSSLNAIAKDGDYLICLDARAADIEPRDGDLVVVIRRQAGLEEITVRRLRYTASGPELRYESTDQKFAGVTVKTKPGRDKSEPEITIRGLVIGIFRPLPAPIPEKFNSVEK